MRGNWADLPKEERTRRNQAKQDKIIDDKGTTAGELKQLLDKEKYANNVGGRRDRRLKKKKQDFDEKRAQHDRKLFNFINSDDSLSEQYETYKQLFKESQLTAEEKQDVRDDILNSHHQLLQWTNGCLEQTGKFVKLEDLSNRDKFDEVYCGFSRWAPNTEGYRLEVSNAVRYTYGRDANNMMVLNVANNLPIHEAGGISDSIEAFVQDVLLKSNAICLHGAVYRTALGGAYTEEEVNLRKELVDKGFEDACAKRFIALKRAAETRGYIFVSCFPTGCGGWHGKTVRDNCRPGERKIPPKVGIDLVRPNSHYDNVASTSTRPRPRPRNAD